MKKRILIFLILISFFSHEIESQIVKKAYTDKSVYVLGEKVFFRFQAINTSTQVDSLIFPDLCEVYPIVDGKNYLSIFHIGCFMAVSKRILSPNDTLEWRWVYPRESSPDSVLKEGKHYVYGNFRSNYSNTDTISFWVKGGINSIEEGKENKTFVLEQNYPNPFNPTTTISFIIPEEDFVTIKIFDVLGKEIAILENGIKKEGKHLIKFDATELTSGIYYYKLITSKYIETKKMLLLR